ncbi:MAG TPA: hypothetical protein VFB59_04800 [Candidatus Saccharimonadales bacterium]|nr:hypothetical protein [Candidatus Saccharimonadales bacterium]
MAEYYKPDRSDPAYDLLTGRVGKIISGEAETVVIDLHPPEHLAALVAHHLRTARRDLQPHVDYICGNLRAAKRDPQERYTNEHDPDPTKRGTDLNRAFKTVGAPTTYEQGRAKRLRPQLRSYKRVLDVHTSTTDCGPNRRFILVARPDNTEVRNIIAASPIEDVIIMPPDIAEPSLIGQVPNSVSFEYNQDFARTPEAMAEMMLVLDGLTTGIQHAPRTRRFYEVFEPIKREEDPGLGTPNFELCRDGYYPVLLGENSYRRNPAVAYVGFKARAPELIEL